MATIHPMLAPWRPSASDPFDRVKAAHLLNRAGFGGTPEEIDNILSLGPEKAVDHLMDFPDAPVEEQTPDSGPNLSSIDGIPKDFRSIAQQLQGKTQEERKQLQMQLMKANRQAVSATVQWWLTRMATGSYPLQEKLTFFWHGHFTTSAKDERQANLMWRQNELLRRNAAGNFEFFVRNIARDPAMLDYLNNNQNRKAHPNENFARELMELFTLGIGNYTEDDIKQSARAFTGWGHDGVDFVFRRGDHDTGQKTFFGHTGNFDGDDIISMILFHPACPKFIAGELYKYFVNDDVNPGLSQALGNTLFDKKYELRPLIRTILTSKAFYDPATIGAQIKSPVQLVIGTVRMLQLQMPQDQILSGWLTQMGQMPMMPPNVRGWPGGHMWINTNTLFIRYNTCVTLAGGAPPDVTRITPKGGVGRTIPPGRVQLPQFNPGDTGNTAAAVASDWVERLIQRPITDDKMKILIDAVGNNPQRPNAGKHIAQLVVSMPEFQLC